MKKIVICLVFLILLANTNSRIKANKEHNTDNDILGNYSFSSIIIERNNIDLSKYKDLSKNKRYINDYIDQVYATDLDEQKKYDELVYNEISRIININEDLDENIYIRIEENDSEEKKYIMHSNFWPLPEFIFKQFVDNEYQGYYVKSQSMQFGIKDKNSFYHVNIHESVSPPFRKNLDLEFTYIENVIIVDFSYIVSYLDNTNIIEGDTVNIEDLSPLLPHESRYYCNDKLIKTIIEYWTPYHEIMKCKIYFKKIYKIEKQ